MKGKIVEVLLIAVMLAALFTGCGGSHSAYYVEPPKGNPECSYLSKDQLKLVDDLLKKFTSWFNEIDPETIQSEDEFANKQYNQITELYDELYETIGNGGSSEESDAIDMALSPVFDAGDVLMYNQFDSENPDKFEIQADTWQNVRSTLVEAINYFYK